MIIIGIDPGSLKTGYGVIEVQQQRHIYLTSGIVRTLSSDISTKLYEIFTGIDRIVTDYQPQQAAIEQVFMHRNANSALKLGQARGAAIIALSHHTLPVGEYSARQVKQSVVGYGGADKAQVGHMVKTLLNLPDNPSEDAADALAIALTHAQVLMTNRKLNQHS